MVKFFATEIDGESHPVSMCILVTYLMTRYFPLEFSRKCIASKTTYYLYLRIYIHVMDHSRLLPGGPSSSEGPTVATQVLSSC